MAATAEELTLLFKLRDQSGAAFTKVKRNISGLGKASRRASRSISSSFNGIKLGRLLTQLTGISVVFASFRAVSGAARSMFSFGEKMSEVSTIADASAKSMKKMADGAIAISKATGLNETDVAAGLYQAISRGVKSGAEAMEFLGVASKFAVAGVTTMDVAVRSIATVMNSFTASVLTAQEASDILFKTVKLGGTTAPELAGALGTVVSSANALGIEFKEVAAAIAVMTQRGLDTNTATTALRAALTGVTKVLTKNEESLASHGIELTASALAGRGLLGTLKLLDAAYGNDRDALRDLFPEMRSFNAIMALITDGGDSLADALLEISDAAGATEIAFGQRMGSMTKRLQVFFNEVRLTFNEVVGTGLLRKIDEMIDRLGGFDKIQHEIKVAAELASGAVDILAEGLIGATKSARLFADETFGGMQNLGVVVKMAFQVLRAEVELLFLEAMDRFQDVLDLIDDLPDAVARAQKQMSGTILGKMLGISVPGEKELNAALKLAEEDMDEATAVLDMYRKDVRDADRELNEFLSMSIQDLAARGGDSIAAAGAWLESRIVEMKKAEAALAGPQAVLDERRKAVEFFGPNDPAKIAREEEESIIRTARKTAKLDEQRAVVNDLLAKYKAFIKDLALIRNGAAGGGILPDGDEQAERLSLFEKYKSAAEAKVVAFFTKLKAEYTKAREVYNEETKEMFESNKRGFAFLRGAVDSLSTAFADVSTGIKSADEAWRDFALNFLQRLAAMLAQTFLLKAAIEALNLIRPGKDGKRGLGDYFGEAVGIVFNSPTVGTPAASTPAVEASIQKATASRGSVAPQGGTVMHVTINAVDSQSFIQAAARDPRGLAEVVASTLKTDPPMQAAFGAGSRL